MADEGLTLWGILVFKNPRSELNAKDLLGSDIMKNYPWLHIDEKPFEGMSFSYTE